MANKETVQDAHDQVQLHGKACDIPHFESRDLVVGEAIKAKAEELAKLIAGSREVQFYQRAEAQIKGNDRIQGLIAQMKKKQKEIVAFESFNNASMVAKIEAEIEALQNELDGIPIVGDFQQSQSDINYLLQLVMSIIRDTVSEKINVESDSGSEPDECID
ncbi:RicAFT regulatory complex protein RicA family protein [Paenibacillus sp. IB182496]|uniref:RicAFT regulatory complex protein RicA family protein n=1 Tax=Paenibacillus sabuli TaxID=2772509 RepID=A0A927GR40_9BACL|nr:YlbF family regulator [Paenibacillus sabuli]MBD2845204.1 RicAFT regulatory complex protein RicA family protein [Paenibacillus sabuli]